MVFLIRSERVLVFHVQPLAKAIDCGGE